MRINGIWIKKIMDLIEKHRRLWKHECFGVNINSSEGSRVSSQGSRADFFFFFLIYLFIYLF